MGADGNVNSLGSLSSFLCVGLAEILQYHVSKDVSRSLVFFA